jgi:hypothetical protein
MLDAYAIRKAVPRILIAAIAINLSIYLCLAAVDITTVVGKGMSQLLTAPFITADSYDISFAKDIDRDAGGLTGGAGIFVAAGGLGALAGAVGAVATAPLATLGMLLILMIPIALTALAVMITIVIRQGLIVFLIIVSPIALALFILPGTEKYFQKWMELFTKTLLVYPIIAIIFAMSDVMGSIIFQSANQGGSAVGIVKIITGVLVIYAPLVLIPFAFRFAGGAMGRLASLATTGASKLSNVGAIKNRRELAKRDLRNMSVQRRADLADRLKTAGSRQANRDGEPLRGLRGGLRRHGVNRAYRGLAGAVAGTNIEAQASALRGNMSKEMNEQINTGRDEEIRGLSVDKQRIDMLRKQDLGQGEEWRYGEDGSLQYRSLNGNAWIKEADVLAGYSRWGNDEYAKQTALSYEMRKANSTEETERIRTNFQSLATGSWGMDPNIATGVLKGAGFENAGKHLQFKHMKANGEVDHKEMIKEIYESKGAYSLAQMSSGMMDELVKASTMDNLDPVAKDQLASITETFMHDAATRGGQIGELEGGIPVSGPMEGMIEIPRAGSEGATRMFNASGAGSVNEKLYELAKNTTRLSRPPDPAKPYSEPDSKQSG